MALISIREYARRKGCSDTNVRKAIAAGKIVKGVDTSGHRPRIDPDVADKEWGNNFDPSYAGRNNKLEDNIAVASAPDSPGVGTGGKRALADIKRDTAEVKLRQEAIKLREMSGQLVDKEKVYRALFVAGQEVRSSFQAIPDRVIDEILAAKDRNSAHGVLFNAITDALETMSDVLSREING